MSIGIAVVAVGSLLIIANSQAHSECHSFIVDALAQHDCQAADARYTGGIITAIIGGVAFLAGILGLAINPQAR